MNPTTLCGGKSGAAGDGFNAVADYDEFAQSEPSTDIDEIERMWKERLDQKIVHGEVQQAELMSMLTDEVVDFVVEYLNMMRDNCVREQEQLSQNSDESPMKFPNGSISSSNNEPTLFDYPGRDYAASFRPSFTPNYESISTTYKPSEQQAAKQRSDSTDTNWTEASTASLCEFYRDDACIPEWITKAANWEGISNF